MGDVGAERAKEVGIIIQGNSSIFQVPFYASFFPFFEFAWLPIL